MPPEQVNKLCICLWHLQLTIQRSFHDFNHEMTDCKDFISQDAHIISQTVQEKLPIVSLVFVYVLYSVWQTKSVYAVTAAKMMPLCWIILLICCYSHSGKSI